MIRCEQCRFWQYLPDEPIPPAWREKKIGLCEEKSKRTRPRELRLFGAHGGCGQFEALEVVQQT